MPGYVRRLDDGKGVVRACFAEYSKGGTQRKVQAMCLQFQRLQPISSSQSRALIMLPDITHLHRFVFVSFACFYSLTSQQDQALCRNGARRKDFRLF